MAAKVVRVQGGCCCCCASGATATDPDPAGDDDGGVAAAATCVRVRLEIVCVLVCWCCGYWRVLGRTINFAKSFLRKPS